MPQDSDEAYFNVLVVTQVWLWSSAFVDFVISAVLVTSLYRYKEGWNSRYVCSFIAYNKKLVSCALAGL